MIIPFGYTMENGRIEINRQQTETLRGIFREYIQGTSLKAKAEELSEDKIEYAPGKYTWNKNRVQRILTDQRYLGTDQYPSIIDESTFQEVQQIMAERNTQKGCNRQEVFSSSVIPILCGKCGHPVIRRYDARWKNTTKHYCTNPDCKAVYCITDKELWDKTSEQLSLMPAETQKPSDELATDIRRLNNEIERDLQRLDADGDSLQKKIYECAAQQYQLNRTVPRESMDFRNADPCSPDFIRKIKQMVAAVHLIDDDTIRLKRISDQAAGKEETEWNR